jgi:di/tripeptidase
MTEALGGIKPKDFVMNGTTEVGILLTKIPNSQVISLGPRVDNLHSP